MSERGRKILGVVLRVVLVAAMAAGALVALRGVSPDRVRLVLRSTNLPALLVFAPLMLALNFFMRAARFSRILASPAGSPQGPGLRWVLGTVVMSHAANNVLPLRAGELVRTRACSRRGYPVADVALSQVTEKLVELGTLLLVTVPVVATSVGTRKPWLLLGALLVVCLPLAIWLLRKLRAAREQKPTLRIEALVLSALFSLVADFADVGLIHVCLRSLGVDDGLRMCILVYAGVNLAIAVPSTPGQIGPLEAGATLTLVALGVPREQALGFALLYRAVQWIPVTLAGATIWLWRAVRPWPGAPRSAA